METELKLPDVTENDVLAGEMKITVRCRDGGTREITVKAMNWRTSLRVAESGIGDAAAEIIRTCLAKKDSGDEVLNTLLPEALFWIQTVAIQLSNGVIEAKKRMAAKAAQKPDSATSLQPSAS